MKRWQVCRGGYPNGWEPPLLETDDADEAIARHDQERAFVSPRSLTTVAIFDNRYGEGEPLSPDAVRDRIARTGP